MTLPRRSGVILHPTSLPGPFGIGDLGEQAYRFVDFLDGTGQTYWQVLPLSPTGYGDSPYQGLSAMAGNPLLINPEMLVGLGHLSSSDLQKVPDFPTDRVDYGWVISYKFELLPRAFANFKAQGSSEQTAAFSHFCHAQSQWLDDVALFMTLKETNENKPWYEWEPTVAKREPQALERARSELAAHIERHQYLQWQFYEQWLALKQYANGLNIQIIGDIPIFIARDHADVWVHRGLFALDEDLEPTFVSGVPPDYFSETGQLWGHPLYRWDVMAQDNYKWWISRFRTAFTQADIVRIDHFRGFYNYWEVPAKEKTAIKGKWRNGPRAALFHSVTGELGQVRIIAEDLGDFDKKSRAGLDKLMREFGYPGMKILQFAFSDGPTDPFLPHNYPRDTVVYTGSHDNDTAVGWYQVTSTEKERDYAHKYLRTDGSNIAWELIAWAWASVANTSLTTVQDLLGLGHKARMNFPGTSGPPNWCWRLLPGQLTDALRNRLLELTAIYGRLDESKMPPETKSVDSDLETKALEEQ